MFDEIMDFRLQHYLRNLIDSLPYQERARLRTLRSCCSTMAKIGGEQRVYLLRSNKGRTSFFGLQSCKNTWVCPHCVAVQMKKYRERIAAAIEMLAEENLVPFMATFVIPHLKPQSCKEVTNVLYETWRTCFQTAFSNRKNTKNGFKTTGAFNTFFHECEVKHYVRVCEHTQGVNGWHPHFHCLFWVPKHRLQLAKKYQAKLIETWRNACLKTYEKYWKKHGTILSEASKRGISRLLFETDAEPVFFSKTSNGDIRQMTAAAYLTGWTLDKEMSNLHYKTAKKEITNHYTPFELLNLAMEGDKRAEKYFLDYLLTVTQKPVHHRVKFSRTGICAAAKTYLQQQKFSAVLKKKQEESTESWAVFAWFTKEEWFLISSDEYAIENIAYLAAINRKDLLRDYLLQVYDCRLHDDLSPIGQMIQDKLYNKQAA